MDEIVQNIPGVCITSAHIIYTSFIERGLTKEEYMRFCDEIWDLLIEDLSDRLDLLRVYEDQNNKH